MAAETAWLCQLCVFLVTEAIIFLIFFLPLNTVFYQRHSHWAITYISHFHSCN